MGKSRTLCLAVLLSLGAEALVFGAIPSSDSISESGSYVFQSYSPNVYKAHPQNWASVQDSRGVMYFGNTDGLLEFDGVTWRLIQLPRSSAARSLATDEQGRVYVGCSGDFGFLEDDRAGGRKFVSLLDRVPQTDRQFAAVWRILPSARGVYFSTYKAIFLLQHDGHVQVFRPKSRFGQAFLYQGRVHVTTKEEGLLQLNGTTFERVPGGEHFAKEDVVAIVPGYEGKQTLIASPSSLFHLTDRGVTPYPTEADAYLSKNAIYSMLRIPGNLIALGTRRGGLVLLDEAAKIRRTITTQDALPSNYVTAMQMDHQGGVWITTDSGIARFNPGLTKYGPSTAIEGKTYVIQRLGTDLYAGTTAGLFRMRLREKGAPLFEPVEGIEGTQYALLQNGFGPEGNEFLSGGLRGIWAVKGTISKKILDTDVIYDASVSLGSPNVVYAAGRSGLFRLRRENSGWMQTAELPSPKDEFRTALDDADGKVWVTTPGAVLRVDLDKRPPLVEKFDAPDGIRTSAYRLNGSIVFASAKGVMRYKEGRLVVDPTFGFKEISSVKEGRAGEIWVTGPGFHTLLKPKNNGYEGHPAPLLEAGIDEIYAMALDADGTCWAAGSDGTLFRWKEQLAGDPNHGFRVLARRVAPIGGNDPLQLPLKRIPHSQNALRFEFAAPFFESPGTVEYQVKLDGSDKAWSSWSPEAHKDYTNLFESRYRFHVRARNPHGQTTEEATLDFRIAPPWFRTIWAYGLYVVALGFGVWGIIRWRVRALEESNRRLEVIVDERTTEVRQQRDQIAAEEKKTESLLLNILPAPVAAELRHNGSVTPMAFDEVTVCFTDFVGFTLSSEKLPPGRLVDALNEYFTCFDEIVGRYGLEKLKTIGDSYMFVSGLPKKRRAHAVDAALAALEMVETVSRIATRMSDVQWKIRIGLHSGPVVAGVVGVRKFAFDVWGDTVNFAARMESSGVPGRVNISSKTCRLLGELIDCEPRGMVRIKEGRELEMFLVRGPAANVSNEEDFRRVYKEEFGEELPAFSGLRREEHVRARSA